ncbi:MAG: hypothetical protein QM831_14100 [Kofleriaceae bacterium]
MRCALIVAIASCSQGPASDKPADTNPPAPVAHIEEGGAELELAAQAFDREATDLRQTGTLQDAHDALVKIQATHEYQRKARHHERLDPQLLAHAISVSNALADRYERGARRLREHDIADGIDEAKRGAEAALKDSFGELGSQVVDELVFVRDDVCRKSETGEMCSQWHALSTLFEWSNVLRSNSWNVVRDAAIKLDSFAHDDHTKAVISRAIGRGPSRGEACGVEDLCESGLACVTESRTCEQECQEFAMEPCPGGLRCVEVAGLPSRVCRQ